MTVAHWANALLDNALGRYDDALTAARQAAEPRQEMTSPRWGLVELIEAAARSGQSEAGADALHPLAATTQASGTDWALGLEARSRALLSKGEDAERLYRKRSARAAFLSPRTVEYHLRKVFTKLRIRSRNELAIALAL